MHDLRVTHCRNNCKHFYSEPVQWFVTPKMPLFSSSKTDSIKRIANQKTGKIFSWRFLRICFPKSRFKVLICNIAIFYNYYILSQSGFETFFPAFIVHKRCGDIKCWKFNILHPFMWSMHANTKSLRCALIFIQINNKYDSLSLRICKHFTINIELIYFWLKMSKHLILVHIEKNNNGI